MKKSLVAFSAILATAGFLAACNSNNNNTTPGTGTNCNGPVNNMQVLYPKPGAQHVSDTLANIYVATKGALSGGNQFNFFLNSSVPLLYPYTSVFYAVSASSVPKPHATPSYSNPTYYASSLQNPPGPQNAIQIFWNDGGTGCTPNNILSTFTTQ